MALRRDLSAIHALGKERDLKRFYCSLMSFFVLLAVREKNKNWS